MDSGSYKLYLSVCLSRFYGVYPLTLGRILIKLDKNVGTSVQLIVLKFHKDRVSFDVIMMSFHIFLKLFLREATLSKRRGKKGNNYAAQNC